MSDETTSQRDTQTSQRETGDTEEKAKSDTKSEDAKKEEAQKEEDTLSEEALRTREAARYRTQVRTMEAQIAELSQKLESVENEKLSETEREQKQRAKLEKERAELEQRAKRAEKLLLSTKAVTKHGLPEDFAERLIGDDEEALDEDAKGIAALIDRLAKEKYRPSAPDLEGGKRTAAQNGITDEDRKRHQQQVARNF